MKKSKEWIEFEEWAERIDKQLKYAKADSCMVCGIKPLKLLEMLKHIIESKDKKLQRLENELLEEIKNRNYYKAKYEEEVNLHRIDY